VNEWKKRNVYLTIIFVTIYIVKKNIAKIWVNYMPEWEVVDKNRKSNEDLKIIAAFLIGISLAVLAYWQNDINFYVCAEHQKICYYEQCGDICPYQYNMTCKDVCVKWKINEDYLPKNKTYEQFHPWLENRTDLYYNFTTTTTTTTILTTTTTMLSPIRCRNISDCDKNMSLPGCKAIDCNTCCCDPSNICWCTLVYCADFCGWTYNGTDLIKTNQTRVWNAKTEWWECK
jgi:hypothetical protein